MLVEVESIDVLDRMMIRKVMEDQCIVCGVLLFRYLYFLLYRCRYEMMQLGLEVEKISVDFVYLVCASSTFDHMSQTSGLYVECLGFHGLDICVFSLPTRQHYT
jgi:hypothetical protein